MPQNHDPEPDLYLLDDALWAAALDADDAGDPTLLRLARRFSKFLDDWDQDPQDQDLDWDGEARAQAPERLLALAPQLPEPIGSQVPRAVERRLQAEAF